jgi:DNA-binding winged helix-turn-helix (wHTH) protein
MITAPNSERHGRVAGIGAFELDLDAAELRRSGRLIALAGQPMRVLITLVEREGAIVTREDLRRELWGDETHVDFDAGLSTCINQIRVALGDRAASPRFIETLPRRGYRLVAPVRWRGAPARFRFRFVRPLGALAVLGLAAIGTALAWPRMAQAPRPIPIAVFAVDVDETAQYLQPVSASLTDALIGALVSEAGPRARVASRAAAREFESMPLDAVQRAGIDYVVFVTLRSQGGPVLVHVKLVGPRGWVRWASDQTMTLDALERDQLRIAAELSRTMVAVIMNPQSAD